MFTLNKVGKNSYRLTNNSYNHYWMMVSLEDLEQLHKTISPEITIHNSDYAKCKECCLSIKSICKKHGVDDWNYCPVCGTMRYDIDYT